MEKHIVDLLESNVRVVLPELGAFIVKQKNPLKLVFNEFLKYNDGLLIEYVAKTEEIGKDQATQKVNDFVAEVKSKLEKNDKVVFPGLGTLLKDATGNIVITTDDQATDKNGKAKDTPKKSAVAAKQEAKKEIKQEVKEEVKASPAQPAPKKEEAKSTPPPQAPAAQKTYTSSRYLEQPSNKSRNRGMTWFLLILFAIIVVLGILYLNKKSDKKKEIAKTEQPAPPKENVVISEPEIDNHVDKTIKAPETKPVTTGQSKRYYIIAGCFKVPQNADRYVTFLRNKGYNSELLGILNGFHTVTFDSYVSKQQALDHLYKIREEYEPDAWLKRY